MTHIPHYRPSAPIFSWLAFPILNYVNDWPTASTSTHIFVPLYTHDKMSTCRRCWPISLSLSSSFPLSGVRRCPIVNIIQKRKLYVYSIYLADNCISTWSCRVHRRTRHCSGTVQTGTRRCRLHSSRPRSRTRICTCSWTPRPRMSHCSCTETMRSRPHWCNMCHLSHERHCGDYSIQFMLWLARQGHQLSIKRIM